MYLKENWQFWDDVMVMKAMDNLKKPAPVQEPVQEPNTNID